MNHTPATPSAPVNFPRPVRTLVVDDSVAFLRTFCFYIKTQPMFQVIGTALSGAEALHMAEVLGPDLVLMDLNMPAMDGLQATAILRRRLPNIRIIIMTMDDSAIAEAQARDHGAHGFIRKRQILDGLLAEVQQAWQ